MSELFFRQLEIPQPDMNLQVGSGTQTQQTADIMKAFEPVVLSYKPDAVLVVGDVNSTVACGLVAAKLGISLIHVEAGLRSFDRSMPEEINRVLTDTISDLLFCSEPSGVKNLLREGTDANKIFLVGNVMIDTLLKNRERAEKSTVLEEVGLIYRKYSVLTLHRPSNVDNGQTLEGILLALGVIQKDMPVVFPVHPRTRRRLQRSPLAGIVRAMPHLRLVDPLGYLDFLKLMSSARIVLTDSGGIQEETTILNVPCLTLRKNTERPVTVEMGTNRIVGTGPATIIEAYENVVNGHVLNLRVPRVPPLWDGCAAERIVEIISKTLVVAGKKPEEHSRVTATVDRKCRTEEAVLQNG
jgi:UDP-N-acetylglucosamine 2-epimerase (non-hydrolysing)